MEFTIVELDRRHQSYVREQLAVHAENGRLLGRLLGELDLDDGRMWAIVPGNRVGQAVADLEGDPIRSEAERRALARTTAERLRSRLDAAPPRLLAFEYWTTADLDGTAPTREFLVGDSVFDYVTASDGDDVLQALLLSSLWYPTVGVLAPIPRGVELDSARELTAEQVAEAVSQLDLMLIGAWGAEGHVFWEPRRDDR